MGLLLFLLIPLSFVGETLALYLSWVDDPTTTMVVQWHTPETEEHAQCLLHLTTNEIRHLDATQSKVGDRWVHTTLIDKLIPNTEYLFQLGSDPTRYSFRTAPTTLTTLSKPLRFVIGGDAFLSKEDFRKICHDIIDQDPLFAIIGGDIAYATKVNPFLTPAHFFLSSKGRWFDFLQEWKEQMITPEGRIIPFLLVPGNHDISHKQHELFFTLFNIPNNTLYRSIDFGNYLSLILLDTGHFHPIEGQQTLWLQETLTKKAGTFSYLFPIYHIAAYPSYYNFTEKVPTQLRKLWCPLFDQYHLPVAFEHHNHAWKKTYPIRGGKIDATGTIYLGDGCWAVPPREPQKQWYLEKAKAQNHIYMVELKPESATIQAITFQGESLDSFTIPNQVASFTGSSSVPPD